MLGLGDSAYYLCEVTTISMFRPQLGLLQNHCLLLEVAYDSKLSCQSQSLKPGLQVLSLGKVSISSGASTGPEMA